VSLRGHALPDRLPVFPILPTMPPPVGFILLTHAQPAQAGRLVARLNAMFDHPPIAWHHDHSKCPVPTTGQPENVRFVRPHRETDWARFSVVEATVDGIRLLYDNEDAPDRFVVLSGSDYPIKPARRILQDLFAGDYDAHLHHLPIEPTGPDGPDTVVTRWQRQCVDRYRTVVLEFPSLTRRLRRTTRRVTLRHPLLAGPFLPFSRRLRCFAGSHWFSAGTRAAATILRFHDSQPALARHYRPLLFPEESYFQCILANASGLRIHAESFRYTAWIEGEAHPKTLGSEDLPALLASPAHFARKFDVAYDARVLDALDEATSG
jgi:hypothetical protein